MGIYFENSSIRFESVDPGVHNHIQDDEIRLVLFEVFHGFFTAGNRCNPVAEPAEHLKGKLSLFRHIINHQY